MALLTPGPISDQSWRVSGSRARPRAPLGASISHIQTKTPAEFEENFRHYGARRYSLVFGHGFEYQDAALRVAPRFPSTVFVVTSSRISGPNYAGMHFAFEEPAYVAGMLAGGVTRSNLIGAIGGTELPPVRMGFSAFAAGVRAVNPAARVVVAYLGNWDDVSAAKEQALAQIARGVDVIFQNADAAGLGVFQAARETRRSLVIGSNADQNAVAPEVTAASVVIDLPEAFLSVARAVQQGRFSPNVTKLDAPTNVVRVALNDALAPRIPIEVRARVDTVWRLLVLRRFEIPLEGSSRAPGR